MNRIVSVLLVNLVLKNNLLYAMCDWGLLTGQRVKGSDDLGHCEFKTQHCQAAPFWSLSTILNPNLNCNCKSIMQFNLSFLSLLTNIRRSKIVKFFKKYTTIFAENTNQLHFPGM